MSSPSLRVSVAEFDRFIRQLSGKNSLSLDQIATGMGLPPTDNPGRSLALHLATARALGVGLVQDGTFHLSVEGRDFLSNSTSRRGTISTAFKEGSLEGFFNNLVGRGQFVPLSQLDEAIALAWGRTNVRLLRGPMKEWLQESGLAREGDNALMISSQSPLTEFENEAFRTSNDARLYSHLLYHGFGEDQGRLSTTSIRKNLEAFRSAEPDRSEPAMKLVVSNMLDCLGFGIQYANGPRELARVRDHIRLDFGTQGDDLIAHMFHPLNSHAQEFLGFVLAIELKRTTADKKSVTQSLALRDRIAEFFRSRMLVLPLVISGEESGRFSDAAARSYAHSSRVVLLSIGQLHDLVTQQRSRFAEASDLILPFDVFVRLSELGESGEVEPYPGSLSFDQGVSVPSEVD